jgi:hypothetical protein
MVGCIWRGFGRVVGFGGFAGLGSGRGETRGMEDDLC